MKRKNKRHKLAAVQFLSSIALDGNDRAKYSIYSSSPHRESLAQSGVHRGVNTVFSSNGCHESHPVRKHLIQFTPSSRKTSPQPEGRKSTINNIHGVPIIPSVENPKEVSCPTVVPTATPCAQTVSFQIHQSNSSNPPNPKLNYAISGESGLKSTLSANFLSSHKRFAVCSAGFRRQVVAVYSVLSYNRKASNFALRSGSRHSCRNISETELYNGSHPKSSVRCLHSPTGSIELPDRGHLLASSEAIPTLSSLAPLGDETLSFARFIHSQVHTWLPNSSSTTPSTPLVRVYGPSGLEPDLLATLGPESIVFVSSASDLTSLADNNVGKTCYVQSRRTLSITPSGTSTSYLPRARQRNPSSTSATGAASATSGGSIALSYPDPLFYYSPVLLDDPALLVATGKRLFQLPNYLVSVLAYVRPTEQKRNVNREFHERFPVIQLTLTKLRSIKFVLVQIVLRLAFDLWIAAHAHVLFEKLILKLFVNKSNRRLCASASLLISAKLNDVKGVDLHNLIQELEGSFRISRRDLLRAELEASLGLEFCLIPTESECAPHYFRIHKLLDLTPPYPISCRVSSANPLRTEAL